MTDCDRDPEIDAGVAAARRRSPWFDRACRELGVADDVLAAVRTFERPELERWVGALEILAQEDADGRYQPVCDCDDGAPLVGRDMVPLLTAARRIGMHPRAARRAAASGLIPAERSGPRGWWHVPRGWADAMAEEAARRRKPDRPDTR